MTDRSEDETHPFFSRVDYLLRKAGRTRKWLAEESGVSANTLNAAFYRNTPPKLDMAMAVADALSTSLDWLLTGDRADAYRRPENDFDLSIETIGVWMIAARGASAEAVQASFDILFNLPAVPERQLSEMRGWVRGSLDARGVRYAPARIDVERMQRLAAELEERRKRF